MGDIKGISELSPRKQKKYSIDIEEYRQDVFTMMNNRRYTLLEYEGPNDNNYRAYLALKGIFSHLNVGNPDRVFYIYDSANSYSIPGKILLILYLGVQIKTQEASLIISGINKYNEIIGVRNERDQIKTHILIASKKIISGAMNKFEDIEIRFEPFMIDEIIDPSKMMIPFRFKVLSSEERAELFRELESTPLDLPQLYEGSPEIKYYGILARNVIKIWHFNFYEPSETPEVIDYKYIKPGNLPDPKKASSTKKT